ncbi:helix-turn-helix transcriptional regulator [Paenibacillus rhizovicinus]|uniref:Helix-turn-helix transcriptional regulator n=1 Tax=Paenibacillus rhizovicinus TaxID=2704463 RepID=A0A6C0P087_9BACL|nr:helix-turn-helix domain-containing protein [Paenibacillus rhizovicinus]QHW31904.1 helix-turn-helix transcriptional regulator [Paenibacillus rhizovicinus]
MRKKWFYRLLFSYTPILFITVTFTFFIFFQLLSDQNRNEAIKANKALSAQALRLIDSSLKAIDNAIMLKSMEIESNQQLLSYFNEHNDDVYARITAVKQMRELMISLPLIDSIYLVRTKDQMVLSNATGGTLSDFLDKPFVELHMSKPSSKWTGARIYRPFTVIEGKRVVSLVRDVPFITGEKGFIVVNVATDSLSKMIADLYDADASFIRVKDTSGSSLLKEDEDTKQAVQSSHYVSGYTGWTYQSGIVNGRLIRLISQLNNIWFLIGIVMIIGSFIWLIYVTRRNYKPIEHIVTKIRDFTNPQAGSLTKTNVGDEFSFIETALEHMITEHSQYQRSHKEGLPSRTHYLFQRLIEGGSSLTNEEWMKEAAYLQLPDPSRMQAVFVVELDHYAEFSSSYSSRDQNLLKFALRSMMQEMSQKFACILWSEWISASSLSVMVFGTEQEDERSPLILELLEDVRGWTASNLKLTVTIGIGEPVRRFSDIPKAFQGALKALKYKAVLGENRVITTEQTVSRGQEVLFSHLTIIRSIVQSIRRLEDWESDYNELFDRMKQGILTKEEVTSLMNYLVYSLSNEMAGMSREYSQHWEGDWLPKLNACLAEFQTLEQMRDQTLGVLTALSDTLREAQTKRQHAATIRDVRKYLELNYANHNLSLDYLSDYFHLNAKYLSKLFKEETGEKFVDFLIDVRMKEAEKLLANTQSTVQEVAEQVGYASNISFSRVFKKVTGSSPSEYRDSLERKAVR